MKPAVSRIFAAVLFAAVVTPASIALAQGGLTPPGPPAPAMKTLSQIEPRTPISSLPFTISQPGSYYVTTNLTGASGGDGLDPGGYCRIRLCLASNNGADGFGWNNDPCECTYEACASIYNSQNSWGPIVDVSAGGDISAIPNSSHPDANFIH